MALTSPNDTLNTFLTYFTPGQLTYGDFAGLTTTLFVPDSGTAPSVGITDGGPAFKNRAAVNMLFRQLFTSFPDLSWTEDNNTRRMTNNNPVMIGTQTKINGTFSMPWFQKVPGQPDTDTHYSKPLSDIHPNPLLPPVAIPAYPVFTLNAAFLIVNLAIYLDRYRLKVAAEGVPS